MNNILPVADDITADEPAWMLVEFDMSPAVASKKGTLFTPDTQEGTHRWQIIGVRRGGQVAYNYRRLGPSVTFKGTQIRLPAFWEHTVAELQDMADFIRARPEETAQNEIQGIKRQDLKGDWLDQKEMVKHYQRTHLRTAPG